ncbi:MAG: carboxypeptidase regulatory-like domain-containing protein [Planctomycetota bacterium]
MALLLCLPAGLLLAGCSQAPYELAPVTGVLTIDGKPFAAGKVMFSPTAKGGSIEGGKAAFGLLDDQGRFSLSTYREGDGAVVGKHWVMLYSLDDRRTDADRRVPRFKRVPVYDTPVEVVAGEANELTLEMSLSQFGTPGRR